MVFFADSIKSLIDGLVFEVFHRIEIGDSSSCLVVSSGSIGINLTPSGAENFAVRAVIAIPILLLTSISKLWMFEITAATLGIKPALSQS